MKNYKFSIAFENVNDQKGYICEKIFDSFSAGSIPIFYGAPNVKDLVPEDTFIHYTDFSTAEELENYLDTIDDQRYHTYLDCVEQFMGSNKYMKFTSKGFVDSVKKAINYCNKNSSQIKNISTIKREFIQKIFRFPNIFWNSKRFTYNFLLGKSY